MKNGLKIFYFFNFISIFFLSFNSVISIENLETIILNNETISLNLLTLPSYIKIITQSKSNLPKYIKLVVNQNNLAENFTTFIINYYQKPDFKERKQFSQSSLGMAFIWLNKEQIINEFYISIESTQKI